MSGKQRARSALTRALTAACVVLLCVFGAGPAGAAAAESRPASTAPSEPGEPGEGPSDPAADPEARTAVRSIARGLPGVRRTPLAVFHVKHPDAPRCGPIAKTAEPALSLRTVRSVVLRC
ncbi:hypothetical protein PV721_04925 [Streptomyces sp. MB09-01]|uniref:hypothetical protein n=1 Tax=Streptomyces sp. MB09-01 TaxID=3028666 RepID=UPI0029AF059E|nr:hypothetical protein [Streptomyces sp. MB09-01]MDX3533717.1 hypothetical protein [Streptomyces sp. MB09-01]